MNMQKNSAALAAYIVPLPHNAARITIGATTSTYANIDTARDLLKAMERDGHVRIVEAPAAALQLEPLPC